MKRNYYLKNTVGIYKVTNNLSGLCYVGQSVRICDRWKEHTSSKKSLLGAAIHSDGIENFTFEVLEELKKEELNEREVWWIQHFDCVYPQGYNKNSGGGAPTFVCPPSDETLQKMREAHKTRAPASAETRQKLSEARKRREEMRRLRGVAAGADTDHREKGQEPPEPTHPPITPSEAALTSEGTGAGKEQVSRKPIKAGPKG